MNMVRDRQGLTIGLMAAALSVALAGCGKSDSPAADSAAPASAAASDTADSKSMGPPAPGGAPAAGADNTAVPDTTTIDGKKVPLKKTASGLRYYDIKVGTGKTAKSGDNVSVQYIGTLLDGTKFDASYDRGTPFDFPLGGGRVIKGWDEGVASMKVGGKRRLVVPGDLAYGPTAPSPAIPPNATLVFDVELVDIK